LTKQFTLGKKERLKSRKQIEHLFKKGNSFSIFPFKIYYVLNLANFELPLSLKLQGASLTPDSELPTLSMGMSIDYKIAIEEGSTMVRIGSLLFGSRKG